MCCFEFFPWMSLTTHSSHSSLILFHSPSVLFFLSLSPHLLHFRCSSCFCSVDKASSGFRNGTCLCLIRRKRRSPESWCRRSWLESPKCAVFWSGETSRLCIRGGWEWDLFMNKNVFRLNAHRIQFSTLPWAIQRPIIHRHGSVWESGESVLKETKASWLQQERALILPHYILLLCQRMGRQTIGEPGWPNGDRQPATLHRCTSSQTFVYLLNSNCLKQLQCHFSIILNSFFMCLCLFASQQFNGLL